MLLRHRTPEIDTTPATLAPGLEHVDQDWVAVLRWLNANKVDYVLVGPVAHAIRGELTARGPVAIVPAPYIRNYERLAAALVAQDAALRSERGLRGVDPRVEVKLTAAKLARGRRWLLRFSGFDLDVESSSTRPSTDRGPHQDSGGPGGDGRRYQELLYESARFQLADGVSAEIAAPEDLELYSHMRRTGVAPEFRITRNEDAPGDRPAVRGARLPDA
jgi:hypothetical protein